MPNAITRIRHLLAEGVEGELAAFLPGGCGTATDRELQCRAAVASTLVAGLELARGEALSLNQTGPWQAIRLTKLREDLE